MVRNIQILINNLIQKSDEALSSAEFNFTNEHYEKLAKIVFTTQYSILLALLHIKTIL